MLSDVGDMIADIALVFHWSLTDLAELSYVELNFWHQRAAERFKRLQV